jgi:TrmH family RNA methyltransferase
MTPDIITSSQNQHVQLMRALASQSKARRKEQAFLAEGARLVEDGLRSGLMPRLVAYKEGLSLRAEDSLTLARSIKAKMSETFPILQIEARLFDELTDTEFSQGIMAVFDIPEKELSDELSFILLLDQLRDPGNMGTILRSAEAAGVQAVFLLPGTTDPWAPKVVRSGMGSHFRLPILNWGIEALEALLSDVRVYYADMNGELNHWQADFRARTALLIGGEADGASEQGRALANTTVSIPMAGSTESLNAAVSAALLMFEVARQRQIS